ncbi:MAG TPA: autotransporter-associated beta strand repeat-containing protein, partial [Candidatus Dormibacteraeota bacterium]|nr:autotransporter-associated beta strand repeat-containing protein [Candidatus Dormibacteraeota bacterium]
MNTPLRTILRLSLMAALCFCATQQTHAATTFLWNVASPGANNWNVNANWLPATANPGSADTAVFGAVGTAANATTINNIVSVNTTITSLVYTNTSSGTWHVTQIPSGVTLTVTGGVTVGGLGAVDSLITADAMVDGGTLLVTGGNYVVGNSGSSSFLNNTNDLSGLSNFVYSVNAGFFNFGASNRAGGTLSLANGSNSITAGTMNIGTGSSSSGGTARMLLGGGTNIFNVNTLTMSAGRETANLQFATGTGGWKLRGTGGTDADRCTVVGGTRDTGGTGGGPSTPQQTTANILANGHPVDLKFSTLTLGRMTRAQSGTDAGYYQGIGNLQFDQGVVDANTINLAICSGNSTNSSGIGTITVGANGTLLVGSMSLANLTSAASAASATGTLLVNGGLALCTNNIVKTTTGLSTGVVAVANSGTLFILGKIGTPANPVDMLNVTNGNLKLRVDGSGSITTNILAATVNPGGTTTFVIDQVTAVAGPTTFPLVSYSTLNGTVAGNFTVTVTPPGYIYSLVDNSAQKRIDLSISPSVIIVPKIWAGLTNGDWDLTTSNWLSSGQVATFSDFDTTVFDDSASNSTVNLTTTFAPATMTMSNSVLNYTFSGTGSIGGTNTLTTKGTGTTILDNSGSNSYTGGTIIGFGTLQIGNSDANGNLPGGTPVTLNGALVYKRSDNITNDNALNGTGSLAQGGAGTLTLAGANGYGATTISSGTLQVGAGGTSGSLGSSAVNDNGALIFNRSDNVTVANAINGSGTVTKNNNNVLTLSASNTYAAGLTVNSGTVRISNTNGAGTGTISVNSGGIAVFGVALTNAITLAGGQLSSSAGLNPLLVDVTAAPGTSSAILYADPNNLAATDPNEMAITGTLHGSGNILLISVTNDPGPDSGNGFRLRGTLPSDFSGTLTLSNKVKGELQTSVAGPFSPAGTGKLVVYGGILTNNTVTGTFSELNLRNNSSGSTVFGNDVEVAGTGLAVVDPLGSAPTATTITMGNLKIGAGQELGVNVNGTASPPTNHPVIFPTVTLNGGNATFSPKTSGWNTAPQWGSELWLGTISELTPGSGFTMTGLLNLALNGSAANTYTGPTTNANGGLVLNKTSGVAIPGYLAVTGGTVTYSNNDQIADSSTVNITGGTLAMNTFNDTVGPVILAGGSITGSGGILSGSSYDAQSGSVSAILGGGAALTKSTGGTVTLTGANTYSGNTLINVGSLALSG